MPPTWSSASSTITGRPCFFASRYAAVSPAGPPPITTVGFSRMSGCASSRGLPSLLLLVIAMVLSRLLVEHSADPDASGPPVERRHHRYPLEAVALGQRLSPLRGAA